MNTIESMHITSVRIFLMSTVRVLKAYFIFENKSWRGA